MKLKTSTKISLKFTIFTISLLLFFGIFANITFFYNRYSRTTREIVQPVNKKINQLYKPRLLKNIYLDGEEELGELDEIDELEFGKMIKENIFFKRISIIGNRYIIFHKTNNGFRVIDVTDRIDSQFNLFFTTIYLIIFFSILSYLLSLFFVKNSLKSLNKLVNFTENLNIDNLNQNIDIDGPDGDEIKIVANSLNNFISKLNKQALALKDFISNTSHELKTPLMIINTDIDYALKSGKHEEGLCNIKDNIKNINDLLNNLILITKIESGYNLKSQSLNISDIFIKNILTIQKQFSEKNISIKSMISDEIYQETNKFSFEIIIKNLVENAFKYAKNNGNIEFYLDQKMLYIKDDGIGIQKSNLDKIWDRFWKEDQSRSEENSFGLGLYIVKKIVEIYNWQISVESEENIGTKFIISFN